MQFPSDEPEHSEPFQLDYIDYIPPPPSPAIEEDEPRWTRRRIVLAVLSLIVVLAMLITFYLPGILVALDNRDRPPQATPTVVPQVRLPDAYEIVLFT